MSADKKTSGFVPFFRSAVQCYRDDHDLGDYHLLVALISREHAQEIIESEEFSNLFICGGAAMYQGAQLCIIYNTLVIVDRSILDIKIQEY